MFVDKSTGKPDGASIPNLQFENGGIVTGDPNWDYYQVNVTYNFKVWFCIGFLIMSSAVMFSLLAGLGLLCKIPIILKISSGCIGFITCVGGLAWFLTG